MAGEAKNACSGAPIDRVGSASQQLDTYQECVDVAPSDVKDKDTREHLFIFHKDSDLTFKVWPEICYKVIEVNVSSASDAFNNLLYEINTRPKKGAWVINLPDDNPQALKVILQIIHFRFGEVPKCPTIDELFEICILVSKYDCTHLIQPWAEKWGGLLKGFANNRNAPTLNFKVLWVSWVLGCVRPFRDMVDSIILTSKIDEHGDLIHACGAKLEDIVLPEHLLDGIIETRLKTLSAILEALRRPMGQMSGLDGSSGVAYCKVGGTDATKCEMMMFASSLPTLAPAGLFLIKKSATYSGSITEIKELIYSIKYEAWEGKNHAPHKAHTSCNLGFKDAIKTILDGMSSPVQKMHLAHLAEQAEITGVYNGTELVGYGSKLSASALEFKPAGHNGSDNSDTTIKTESASGDNDSEVKEETAGDSSGEISLTPPSDVFSEAKEQETQM